MNGLTHFALGLTAGLLFLVPLVSDDNKIPVFVASGIFAMMPDMANFIEESATLFDGWWINLFWLHGVLDSLETQYPNGEALVTVTILTVGVILNRVRS